MEHKSGVENLRSWLPLSLRRKVPRPLKDWIYKQVYAVRHPVFRDPAYRRLRKLAQPFNSGKPLQEQLHQRSFLLARWFAEAGIRSAFHVGYASGRHIFYLTQRGIVCAGTDLPPDKTSWVRLPRGAFDAATMQRLLRKDFFHLSRNDVHAVWQGTDIERAD